MEHQGYARNAGAVFSLKYHLVFCPKYRKSVLVGPVAERLQALLAIKADELHVTLHTLEVMPDHVHVFVESDPGMAPAKLAAQLKQKGVSDEEIVVTVESVHRTDGHPKTH